MSNKPSKQDHALVTYFAKESGQKINRYKAVWAAKALLEDYEYASLIEAIDWFIAVDAWPTWEKFTYRVAEVLDAVKMAKIDRQRRQTARDITRRLVEEDAQC